MYGLYILSGLIVCCALGAWFGSMRGRRGLGAALGLCLGPIGLILIAVLPPDQSRLDDEAIAGGDARRCPHCAEVVKKDALVCKHCGITMPRTFSAAVESARTAPMPAVDPKWICACGAPNSATVAACEFCGARRPGH